MEVALPVFVDTSALVALLDDTDFRHAVAQRVWRELVEGERDHTRKLLTHYAIITETSAVLARHLGFAAQRIFLNDVLPAVRVLYVTEEIDLRARDEFLRQARRNLSLTDCLSFEVMRAHGIRHAFAWDQDFAEQGFLPPPEVQGMSDPE